MRTKRSGECNKRMTASLVLVADYEFFKHIGQNKISITINYIVCYGLIFTDALIQVMHAVLDAFKFLLLSKIFFGIGETVNINFRIQLILYMPLTLTANRAQMFNMNLSLSKYNNLI